MSQESEQAQEAWRKHRGTIPYPCRGAVSLAVRDLDAINEFKAAIKAEIEKHKRMLEEAQTAAEEKGLEQVVTILEQAIAEMEVVLSIIETVKPL